MPDLYHAPALVLTALLIPAFGYLYHRFRDIRTLLWLLGFCCAEVAMILLYSIEADGLSGVVHPWLGAAGQTVFLIGTALFLASLSPLSFRVGGLRILYVQYVGRQKVDEVDCYVFDVAPKTIEKRQRYLDGRIWVDAHDLQIVVTNGRMVPDDTKKGEEDLHPPFMTWRQQIDGHYWFPVYTKGEGILHFSGGNGYMDQDVHIRDVIKYTDYKRFGSTTKIIYDGQDITQDGQQPNGQQGSQQPAAPPHK